MKMLPRNTKGATAFRNDTRKIKNWLNQKESEELFTISFSYSHRYTRSFVVTSLSFTFELGFIMYDILYNFSLTLQDFATSTKELRAIISILAI